MSNAWNFPGSRWWKFDFHTHTPASYDYGLGDDSFMSITPEKWLQMAMQSGIDCVAVTDHNTGSWVDRLKAKYHELREQETRPDWFRELIIFPGTEITVADSGNHIHLLAVFDPDTDSREIVRVLGTCGITRGYGNSWEAVTKTGFSETVERIIKANGIAIPAHIDGPQGLLYGSSKLTPSLAQKLEKVFAAEFSDPGSFDNADESLKKAVEHFAKVSSSDAHKPHEIGRGYSWIKMSTPSIESLRLALQNPGLCVKNQQENPSRFPDMFLSKLTVRNMRYCGRIDNQPFVVQLHPHFNSIIGGRGSGKSTVLESIRIALRRDQNLSVEAPRTKDELDKFMRPSQSNGVMEDNTRISVNIHRRGINYRLHWEMNGGVPILEMENNGTWQSTDDSDLTARFPISIFSQNQISELASNPQGLLEIMDRAPNMNKTQWKSRWEITKSQFLQLREQKRRLSMQLATDQPIRAQLKDIENDLRPYEEKGQGEILRHYQKRVQQNNGLPDSRVFDELSSGIRELIANNQLSDFPAHLFDEQDETTAEIRDIHEQSMQQLDLVSEELLRMAERIDTLKAERTNAVQSGKWHMVVQESIAAYARLAEEYKGKENSLSISRYGELIQQRSQLQQNLRRLEFIREEAELTEKQIRQLMDQLLELRFELFEKRRAFLEEVIGSNSFIRMELIQYGDVSTLKEEYGALLHLEKDRFDSSIFDQENQQGLLWELQSWEERRVAESTLPELVSRIKSETFDIASGNRKAKQEAFDNRLKKLKETQPAAFDQLDTWWPEDLLRITYSREPSSGKFYALEKGSAGQKAAAILAFLLSYGNDPLIIDQPEDDLDNALIYDLIVRQIHENKSRRQLIIATHNPNIVVNGDSELVHVMNFRNEQVHVDQQGGLDESTVRERICTIMEGGQQAFDKRYRRIRLRE